MALQVWLPLLGDTTNQGVSDLTFSIVNSSTTTNSAGKIGSCYYNSSNTTGGLLSNKTINLGQKQSMFCWFKVTNFYASSALGGGLVSQHRYPSNCGMGITLKYVSTTTGYLSVNTGNGSSRTYNTYCGTTLLQAGTWYHGGYTYDGSTIKIYVNGVCENTVSYTGMSVPADYLTVFCWSFASTSGSSIYGAYNLYGYINDVRVYDHCLSAKEIKEISKALIVHYPLDFNGRPKDNIVAGTKWDEQSWTYPTSSYSDKFAATTSIVPSASQYVLSFYAKSTVDKDKIRTHWYSPNTTTKCESSQGTVTTASDGNIDYTLSTSWKRYWCIYTQSSTTAVKHLICPRLLSGQGTGTVSVKGIKIEEGTIPTPWMPNSGDNLYSVYNSDGTKVYDTSGYCRHGITSGTLYVSNDTKRYLIGTNFNQSGYISISDFNVNLSAYTLNLWIKPKAMTTSQHFLFGTFTSWTGHGIGIWRDSGAANKYNLLVKSDSASSYANNPIYLTLDAWNMITMVYNGTSVTGYLNGTQYYTVSYGSNGNITNPNLMLGNSKYNSTAASENDEAIMSDFRLYATALSAKDIQELYNSPISIGDNGSMIIEGSFDEN